MRAISLTSPETAAGCDTCHVNAQIVAKWVFAALSTPKGISVKLLYFFLFFKTIIKLVEPMVFNISLYGGRKKVVKVSAESKRRHPELHFCSTYYTTEMYRT